MGLRCGDPYGPPDKLGSQSVDFAEVQIPGWDPYSYARLWPVAVGRIDVLRRPNDHRASSLHPVAVCVLVRIKSVARAADSHTNL